MRASALQSSLFDLGPQCLVDDAEGGVSYRPGVFDPGLVARLGRGARAFAEGFSWDKAAQATEAHLENVVAQGGRS